MRKYVAVAACGLLAGCVAPNVPTPFEPSAELEEVAPAVLEAAKDSVRQKLKDPYSAQFSGLYAVKATGRSSDATVCGYVNAKNSYGGYTGKTAFVVKGAFVSLWQSGPNISSLDRTMNEILLKTCALRPGQKVPAS